MKATQRRWWARQLTHVYDSYKHKGANVTNQYVHVARLLDYLEEIEPTPPDYDLTQECDRLCFKIRNS